MESTAPADVREYFRGWLLKQCYNQTYLEALGVTGFGAVHQHSTGATLSWFNNCVHQRTFPAPTQSEQPTFPVHAEDHQ